MSGDYASMIELAQAGECSHGGHGWDGETCSDIPLAPPAAQRRSEVRLLVAQRGWTREVERLASMRVAIAMQSAGLTPPPPPSDADCCPALVQLHHWQRELRELHAESTS